MAADAEIPNTIRTGKDQARWPGRVPELRAPLRGRNACLPPALSSGRGFSKRCWLARIVHHLSLSMELMEVYHEAMAAWIIARVTSGKCEGAAFVFGLIESAIRKEATEILLTPVQELDMVRMDFGRLHCYYRQPEITRAQFAYLSIYLVFIGNVAAGEARTERLFRGSDERLYNLQFGKMRLPDSEPAVVIYIEPVRPAI